MESSLQGNTSALILDLCASTVGFSETYKDRVVQKKDKYMLRTQAHCTLIWQDQSQEGPKEEMNAG
jgi:hypothetical protein